MTGKIFRSCFLVGLAMMVLCTALFLVVMTNKHEQTVYAEMRQEMCYVRPRPGAVRQGVSDHPDRHAGAPDLGGQGRHRPLRQRG